MRKNLVARVGMFVMTCMLSSTLALSNPVKAMAAEPTATETVTEDGDNAQAEDAQAEDKAEDAQVEDKAEDTQVEDKAEDTQVEDKAEDTQVEDKAEDAQVEDKAEDTQDAKAGSGLVGNADKTAGFITDFTNNEVQAEVDVKQQDQQNQEIGENPSDEPEDATIPEDQTVQPAESTPTPAPTSEPKATTSDNKEDKVVDNPDQKQADQTVEEHHDNEQKLVPQQTEPQGQAVEETKEEPKKDTPAPTVSENTNAPAPTPAPVKVVEDKKDKGDEPKNDVPTVNNEPAPKKVSGGNGGGRSSRKVTPVVIIKEESNPTPASEIVIPDTAPQAVVEEAQAQDVYVPDTMSKAVPKTGDCNPIAVYAMIFFGSLIALAVFLLGAICGACKVLASRHVVCDIKGNKETAAASILFEQVEDALVRNNRHVRNVNEARIHLTMNSVRRALGLERVQSVTYDRCDEGTILPSASVAAEHSVNQLFSNGIRSNAVEQKSCMGIAQERLFPRLKKM